MGINYQVIKSDTIPLRSITDVVWLRTFRTAVFVSPSFISVLNFSKTEIKACLASNHDLL